MRFQWVVILLLGLTATLHRTAVEAASVNDFIDFSSDSNGTSGLCVRTYGETRSIANELTLDRFERAGLLTHLSPARRISYSGAQRWRSGLTF